MLDLVLTNLEKYYEKPIKFSAFGLSDHVTIAVKTKAKMHVQSCEEKTSMLEEIIKIGLYAIMPLESKTVISNEPV